MKAPGMPKQYDELKSPAIKTRLHESPASELQGVITHSSEHSLAFVEPSYSFGVQKANLAVRNRLMYARPPGFARPHHPTA